MFIFSRWTNVIITIFWNSLWGKSFQKCQEAIRPGTPEVHELGYQKSSEFLHKIIKVFWISPATPQNSATVCMLAYIFSLKQFVCRNVHTYMAHFTSTFFRKYCGWLVHCRLNVYSLLLQIWNRMKRIWDHLIYSRDH